MSINKLKHTSYWMHRQIATILLGILVISSCTKEEVINQSNQRIMTFEMQIPNTQTRLSSKDTLIAGDQMGIFGYSHGKKAWSSISVIENEISYTKMHNTAVEKQLDKSWTYSPLQYWEGDDYHTFLAYFPINDSFKDLYNNGAISEYTTPPLASSQVDLLHSEPAKDQVWSANKTIRFNFTHAMSQVNFSIKTKENYSTFYSFTINKVDIKGLKDKATFNLNIESIKNNPWSNLSSSKDNFTAIANCSIMVNTMYQKITDSQAVFMLIPQSIDENKVKDYLNVDIEAKEFVIPSYAENNKSI